MTRSRRPSTRARGPATLRSMLRVREATRRLADQARASLRHRRPVPGSTGLRASGRVRLSTTPALVAQLDRASDYGSEGWGFESLQRALKSGRRLRWWSRAVGRTALRFERMARLKTDWDRGTPSRATRTSNQRPKRRVVPIRAHDPRKVSPGRSRIKSSATVPSISCSRRGGGTTSTPNGTTRWSRRSSSAWRSFSRLILFDQRGVGLSDPVPLDGLPTLEQWMDDMRVVLDAVGSSTRGGARPRRRRSRQHPVRGDVPGADLGARARRLVCATCQDGDYPGWTDEGVEFFLHEFRTTWGSGALDPVPGARRGGRRRLPGTVGARASGSR